MASAPSEPRPVIGRLDKAGRLVAADPELEALQRQAGSGLGQELALPQVAAVVRLARKLGIPVSRPAIAASIDHDIDLWVRATPEGEGVAWSLEGWTERGPAEPMKAACWSGRAKWSPRPTGARPASAGPQSSKARTRCRRKPRAAPPSTMRWMKCCVRRSTGSSRARSGSSNAPTGRYAAIM